MVGIARDVHDTHKHGPLTRRTARIKKGQGPRVVEWGGGISGAAINEAPISGGNLELGAVLDDGTSYPVESVVRDALDYWTAELMRLGL
jgi:hypothetical protein